ncbi:hypothetical protein ACFFIF_01875 [Vagococcus entomophilus]|uniref:Uncharacterized protein n=1 Tax=Vagococcus entomophilus TaxID=1160095 RepID=A0A430AK67_9ENTE|nr:hypothetical protein [Vagococcus entomophilus]RSU08449.1 hypothetical protein CBF30_04205 [Vagococcus entomophilus]
MTSQKEYFSVIGVTDYFRYDNKIILFENEKQAKGVAEKIGSCDIEKITIFSNKKHVLISDLRGGELNK